MKLFAWILPFFFLGLAFLKVTQAHAQETPNTYVVSDLVIDMKADNAVMAREKAFGEALEQGFARLLEQIVPDPIDRAEVQPPETSELGRMLQDFTTRNEQLSPTRYAAIYELRFKPARVQSYLKTARASMAAMVRPEPAAPTALSPAPHPAHAPAPILVIPFYQENGLPVLWSGINPLREALAHQPPGETPIQMPLGDLEDTQLLDESKGVSYAPEQMRALLEKYEAARALIVMAIPDRRGEGGLTLMLYRADMAALSPTYVDTISLPSVLGEDPAAFYARSAAQLRMSVRDMMQRDPVAVLPQDPTLDELRPDSSSLQTIGVRAHFESLMEWQQIRTRLAAAAGVQSVRVLSLKVQEARAELVYTGTPEDLALELTRQGLAADQDEGASPEIPAGAPPADILYNVSLLPAPAGGV